MEKRVSDKRLIEVFARVGSAYATAEEVGISRNAVRERLIRLGIPRKKMTDRSVPPDCHPDRENFSVGMCKRCYMREYQRIYYTTDKSRDNYYRTKYGISYQDYLNMQMRQNNRCAICGKLSPTKRLAADHDREIQREYGVTVVRGLLCTQCNQSVIGGVEYSDEVMRNAIKYMQKIIRLRKKYKEKAIG